MTNAVADHRPQRWWSRGWARLDWRRTLVLTMIVVGMSGACVAYLVGVHELEATHYEREYVQDYVLAMNERHLLLDVRDANAEFRRRADAAEARGNAYLEAASLARQAPRNAELLSLQAQEEFAARRSLVPFITATGRAVDGVADDRAIQRAIARNVAKGGREADETAGFIAMYSKLDEQIEAGHKTVTELAFTVVLFVVSLVMFTFASLSFGRTAHALMFAGIAFAFATALWIVRLIPDIWAPAAVILVLLAACALLAWKVGAPPRRGAAGHGLEPVEVEVRAAPVKELHAHDEAQERARRTVKWIAWTVLLSSVSGLGYSLATTASSEATHAALKAEIRMHLVNTNRQAAAVDRLHRLSQMQEERTRFAAAMQRAAYFKAAGDLAAAEIAVAEARLFQRVPSDDDAARRQKVMRMLDELNTVGQENPRFLQSVVRRIDHTRRDDNHWESLALWDIYNQRSLASSETAARLLWTLTMFAVALYFFGQALGMKGGKTGQVLARAGMVLVSVAVVSAIYAVISAHCQVNRGEVACRGFGAKDATSSEVQAATDYAYAKALLSDAQSEEDYDFAIDALARAVAVLPDWRLAQLDYVSAVARRAMFVSNESFRRLPHMESLGKTIATMEDALARLRRIDKGGLDKGPKPVGMLASLGRYMWLEAVAGNGSASAGDRKRGIDRSVAILEEASPAADAGDGTDFDRARVYSTLVAVFALRGSNDEDHKKAERYLARFGGALDAMQANGTFRNAAASIVARLMTDLDVGIAYCAGLRPRRECEGRVNELKERLVRRTWGDASQRPASLGDRARMQVSVLPGKVRWQVADATFGKADNAVVVWYQRDAAWNAWRAISEVSGRVQSQELHSSAGKWVTRHFLESSNYSRCLGADGQERYRAELYVNGRLALSGEAAAQAGRFQAVRLPALNVALCKPVAWLADDTSAAAAEGALAYGLSTPAGDSLLKVFAYFVPRIAANAGSREDSLQLVRVSLEKAGLVDPGPQAYARYDGESQQACEAAMDKEKKRIYVDEIGADGMRYVGFAMPSEAYAAELCAVLDSITPLFPAPASQQPGIKGRPG